MAVVYTLHYRLVEPLDRNALIERWEKVNDAAFFDAWKAAEEEVVTWVWSDGPISTLVPFGFELLRKKGRVLVRPPAAPRDGLFLQGFDAQGRLRAIREYVDQGGGRPLGDWATVIHYEGERVSWVEYGAEPSRKPRSASLLTTDSGQPVLYEMLQNSAYEQHRYARDDQAQIVGLTRTRTSSWRARASKHQHQRVAFSMHYADDELVGIDREGVAVFRALALGDLRSLANEFVEIMVRDIPERVRKMRLDGPLADLAIVFWPAHGAPLPPLIAVCDEREHEALRARRADTLPAERKHFGGGALADPSGPHRLTDIALTLNDQLSTTAVLKALRNIVRGLRALPPSVWPALAPEFAIYVCDMNGRIDRSLGRR